MIKVSSYKCPVCNMRYKSLAAWGDHLKRIHPNEIPEGYSISRYFYYCQTGRTEGRCIQCHKPTTWNEETQKYNRYCSNPRCKEEYCKIAKQRMVDKYGKTHLLNDPQKQREMLSHRKISGEYTFQDGGKVSYVGSYEKDFLITCDYVLGLKSTDIMSPSPHNYIYMYEGKPHVYIPDFYIPNYNLEIEVKDGGDNPNNHHKIQEVDKVKEALKDQVMVKNPSVLYFKVINKDYRDFYKFILDCKFAIDEEVKKNINSKLSAATEAALSSVERTDFGLPDKKKYPMPDAEPVKESSMKSTITADFKSKGNKSLSSFKCINATPELRDKYKKDLKMVRHTFASNKSCKTMYWLDDNKIVALVSVNYSDPNYNWITAIEVHPDYRGYGLGKQILEYAITKLNGNALGVASDNEIAMTMYAKRGFKRFNHKEYSNSTNIAMVLENAVFYEGSPSSGICSLVPKKMTTKDFKNIPDTSILHMTRDAYFAKLERNPSSLRNVENYGFYNPVNNILMGILTISHPNEDENCIDLLVVAEEYRRQGLATHMLDCAVNEFGATWLTVKKSNVPAINMYKKYGFEITDAYQGKTGTVHRMEYYNSANECVSAIESPSKIDPNFKAKGHLSLSKFRVVKITKAFLDKYKDRYSHLLDGVPSSSEKEVSVAWLDENDEIVAGVCVKYPDPKISDDYKHGNLIRCLEISDEYRGYGLSKQVLDYAVKKLKGNALYVMTDNKVAMKIYEDYGFKTTPTGKVKVRYGKGSYYQMTLTGTEPAKESAYEEANESVIFNRKDSYYNLNKWKTGKDSNILFICGHSGSGKSTLGRQISSEYNAIYIELDEYIRGEYCEPKWDPTSSNTREENLLKEFYSHPEFNFDRNKLSNASFCNSVNKAMAWLYKYANTHPGTLFVWEGVAIHNFMAFEFLKEKPVIIKGTSMLSSKIRAQKRDGSYGTSTLNEYGPEEQRINKLRKFMNSNAFVTNDYRASIHVDSTAMESCVSLANANVERYNGKKYYPLYIVLMVNRSPLGDGIRAVTGEPYSHSSISFDASMQDLYTFGNKIIKKGMYTKREFGSAREAFKHDDLKFSYPPNTGSDIYVMFFNEKQINAIRKKVDDIFVHHDQYKYNISGLIKYVFGLPTKDPHKMFCSQFVAMILNEGKKGILTRDPSLYSPYGITELRGIHYVYGCTIGTYDQKIVEKKTKQIFERIVKSGDLSALEATNSLFDDVDIDDVAMESTISNSDESLYYTVESVATFEQDPKYDFKTPKELIDWMNKNIKYRNYSKLMSSDEVFIKKYGSCHDQAIFIQRMLNRMGIQSNREFFIAFKEGSEVGGQTHTFVYFTDPDNGMVTWVENAWEDCRGVRVYKNINALRQDIFDKYKKEKESKDFPSLLFKPVSGVKPGMKLNEYVDAVLKSKSEEIILE